MVVSLIPRISIDAYILALFICYSHSYNAFYSYIYIYVDAVCMLFSIIQRLHMHTYDERSNCRLTTDASTHSTPDY